MRIDEEGFKPPTCWKCRTTTGNGWDSVHERWECVVCAISRANQKQRIIDRLRSLFPIEDQWSKHDQG